MTLKEIAKEAGVSVSTVSRVINQENTSQSQSAGPYMGDYPSYRLFTE